MSCQESTSSSEVFHVSSILDREKNMKMFLTDEDEADEKKTKVARLADEPSGIQVKILGTIREGGIKDETHVVRVSLNCPPAD